jgi:hypothetical protein
MKFCVQFEYESVYIITYEEVYEILMMFLMGIVSPKMQLV